MAPSYLSCSHALCHWCVHEKKIDTDTISTLETAEHNDETPCKQRSLLPGLLTTESGHRNLQPTFLIVGRAVFKQAAELVAIEMQKAQLVSEWGFFEDTWDDAAHAVLRYGQAEPQGQGRGQVNLLDHFGLLHSHWHEDNNTQGKQ